MGRCKSRLPGGGSTVSYTGLPPLKGSVKKRRTLLLVAAVAPVSMTVTYNNAMRDAKRSKLIQWRYKRDKRYLTTN